MEDQVRQRKAKTSVTNQSTSENCNSSVNIGYSSNEGDNIKVYVRIRPPATEIHEGNVDNDFCLEASSPNSLTIATKPEPKQFSYDHVADMATTQEEVFATVGKGIIEQFIGGFNGTIFAYGQTGSGKTFTMLGPPDDSDNFTHDLRGVIPRGFEYIFSLMNRQQEKVGQRVEFLTKCSFLEIYNEQVYDLLEPSTAGLHLRENIKKGVFVEGLAEKTVSSAKDAYNVLQSGWLNRRVASTSMNRESSRSHAVFTIFLESKTRSAGGVANIKESKLHLVDLAGSERQKDTQTQDVRLKEAGSINKSLSALGNVIMALVDIAHGKTRYIHYRDSKLTFILRDSLGGNAKTYIIANVHPSSRCFAETLSTLNFARRAKMIKNKAIINEDVTGNVRELQAEIKKLKEILQAKSQSSPVNVSEGESVGTPAVPKTPSGTSDDAARWQEMMMSAIGERELAEAEKVTLQEKVLKLEELGSKKEKFLQSTRMILKFRTQHIAKLERKLKKDNGIVEEDEKDKYIKLLKDEIKILQNSIEHHPEVKKFAMENLDLRAEIKKLKVQDPSSGDFTKDMAEKHRYTLQLERQLRELMTVQSTDQSHSQQSIDASNAEIEKIKMELAQVQAKLDTSQNDLLESRQSLQKASEELILKTETFRNKEMELESDLAAVRKAKNEVERTLEAFQLKTTVERTMMNSLHMQTVKTLASPRKFGTPHKLTPQLLGKNSTPLKHQIMNGNKPNDICTNGSHDVDKKNEKNSLDDNDLLDDVTPPKIMLRHDSLNDISDYDNEDVRFPTWDLGEETRDDEIVYIETLQDEIKQLQDLYSQSIDSLNHEKKKCIPFIETIAKLEHKVKEMDQLLHSERKSTSTNDAEYVNQINSLKDKYKDSHGNLTLLKSEVEDLRIMYSSTCKQFDSLKKEKDEEHIESGRKYAAMESNLVKLQIDYYNLRGEMDQTVEANNNLQVDYEQCKEELQFTHHQNSELNGMISQEKGNVKEAELRLESALEKLRYELETKITLTQEDKQEELMKSMETITELREELHTLTKKCEEQEQTITKQMGNLDRQRAELVTQKWLNLSHKEANNKFMNTINELHVTINEKENLVTSLQSEVKDLEKEHENLKELCNEKKKKIHGLTDSIKLESEKFTKEKVEHEKEVRVLQEEIQMAHDQCKELTSTLDDHQHQIQSLQVENMEGKNVLSEKLHEVFTLEEILLEMKQKNNEHMNSGGDNYITAAENLTQLSESWDAIKIDLEMDNKVLQLRIEELEGADSGRDLLENRINMLELELEDSENLKKEKQQKVLELDLQSKQLKEEKIQKELALEEALTNTKNLLNEKKTLNDELSTLKMNLFNLQDDLEINIEELEKTKALEQKYFEENNNLQSKLAVAEEEKNRYKLKLKELQKKIDNLELDKAKLVAHNNTNQRIDHLVNIKKENNSLRAELRRIQGKAITC